MYQHYKPEWDYTDVATAGETDTKNVGLQIVTLSYFISSRLTE